MTFCAKLTWLLLYFSFLLGAFKSSHEMAFKFSILFCNSLCRALHYCWKCFRMIFQHLELSNFVSREGY